MRKFLCLILLATTAAANAIVIWPLPFFTTIPAMQENFDSMLPGAFFAHQVFSAPVAATVYCLPPFAGALDIGPPPGFQPPALSAPNTLLGNNNDVAIRMWPPMRLFGGYFRNSPNFAGVSPTSAQFVFFDMSNNVIGSQTVPLTNTWTWQGFMTVPQLWTRVEIYSNDPFGGVEMDSLRVRPF